MTPAIAAPKAPAAAVRVAPPVVHYRTTTIDGVKMFYREAGPADAPVVVLLHGFPTSSHMFRNLIPLLARSLPRDRPPTIRALAKATPPTTPSSSTASATTPTWSTLC
jgi:hypothetical protein